MSQPGSFPVGKVNFLKLFPLTFLEFLSAVGEDQYKKLLVEKNSFEPISDAFHQDLNQLLLIFQFVGGMPEAVEYYARTNNLAEIRKIHQKIINSYLLDFARHTPAWDIPKLSLIWEAIPSYLSKKNKKFIFSALKRGVRTREYENALQWLVDAGLIARVCP